MSWKSRDSYFAPYVPVAERRRQAQALATKAAKSGKSMSPVTIEGRKIASTFWGQSWCDHLESYSDYENRLPRGRTYVRNGSVIDLQIGRGSIAGQVYGSSLYKVKITIAEMDPKAWSTFKSRCAGKISSLMDLLQGRLDKGVLAEITSKTGGLFPSPKEIRFSCSCPDGAFMCKHIAAVLYGVGARLDTQPDLFFTLRRAELQELLSAAAASASNASAGPDTDTLAAENLSALFGVDIEDSFTPAATKSAPRKSRTARKKAAPAPKKPARPAAAAAAAAAASPKKPAPRPTPIRRRRGGATRASKNAR